MAPPKRIILRSNSTSSTEEAQPPPSPKRSSGRRAAGLPPAVAPTRVLGGGSPTRTRVIKLTRPTRRRDVDESSVVTETSESFVTSLGESMAGYEDSLPDDQDDDGLLPDGAPGVSVEEDIEEEALLEIRTLQNAKKTRRQMALHESTVQPAQAPSREDVLLRDSRVYMSAAAREEATEEEQLRKNEQNRRRLLQRDQLLEKAKAATIDRLLRKQGSRSKKMVTGGTKEGAEEDAVAPPPPSGGERSACAAVEEERGDAPILPTWTRYIANGGGARLILGDAVPSLPSGHHDNQRAGGIGRACSVASCGRAACGASPSNGELICGRLECYQSTARLA